MKTGLIWKFSCILISICFVISCSSGGGGGDSTTPTSTSGTSVSGVASKGIISGGTVRVYAIKSNGLKGQLLGTGTTDDDGVFHADIGNYNGPVLLEVTGGQYVDEATGTVTDYNDTMRAALPSISDDTELAVTPLTEIAARLAEAGGGFDPVKIEDANELISQLIGADIIATLPTDCNDAQEFGNASQDERNYALFMAAISQLSEDSGQDLEIILDYIEDDIADLELDEIGLSLTTAIDAFLNSDENNTGASDASDLVDNIVAIVNDGLEPTGELVDAKEFLAIFLITPTNENYDSLMYYMETFIADSSEAHLFKAMANLMDIYQNSASDFLTLNGFDLDALYNETFDADAFIDVLLHLATVDEDIAVLLAELETRLQEVYTDLGFAEGVKTTISLSGVGTTYFDDVDVKILKAITSAWQAACIFARTIDLAVDNWVVIDASGIGTVDVRTLIQNDVDLTEDQESEFITNNPDLLTYLDSASDQLGLFRAMVVDAADDFQTVVDALGALGKTGRKARVENAFNLDSDIDYYMLKAMSEESMPSVIEAMANANASFVIAEDEETNGSLFLNAEDGFTYRKYEHAIYLYTHEPVVAGPITISDIVNGNQSLRDLFDITTDPYIEDSTPELYMQNVEDIDWEEPIESFTMPTAAINIDGYATDWENVPVLHSSGGLTVKIAAGQGNTYYVYVHRPDGFDDAGDESNLYLGKHWPFDDEIAPPGDNWFWAYMSIYNWGQGVELYASDYSTSAAAQELIQNGDSVVGFEVQFGQFDRLVEESYVNHVAVDWFINGVYNESEKDLKIYP